MLTLPRRTAIGATTLALVLAAAGSSLAAVRAARYEGGVVGASLGARPGSGSPGDPATALPPTAEIPLLPESGPLVPDVVNPSAGLGPAAPGASLDPGTTPGGPAVPGPALAPVPGPGQPVAAAVQRAAPRPAPPPTLGPAAGPTPTTSPVRSTSCPRDDGAGALPAPSGRLKAVDFTLPWPGVGPLVLRPQVSASRGNGPVRLAATSGGILSEAGLVLFNPLVIRYTLEAGNERSSGSIAFTHPVLTDHVERRACRDRSLVLYDVARARLGDSPLRIVGVVAPAGTVTIGDDGGTARFRSAIPGHYGVTLVTAGDNGAAGPLVTATVVVP